jgi:NAD-dependent dihydropyrimidine dehydrogenase PreA subunit
MIQIDENKCLGCGSCLDACDYGALELAKISKSYEIVVSNGTECTSCECCVDMCPNIALSLL